MIPLEEALASERKLSAFFWAEQERPRQPMDIFLNPERTPRPDAAAVSASEEEEEDEYEE